LELFLNACEAVQHAHQKGVIHRDLKPSNILVGNRDDRPVLKVIDFGIAKAMGQPLTDKTVFTGTSQMMGTPLYMSPEQASDRAMDVDTRSDIYSLGAVLYELLTDVTPIDKARLQKSGYDEIRRIIREEEPPKPSTRLADLKRSREVLGDLDWIAMKCLEKDRNRRYETANGLAQDSQGYWAEEPVLAGPPSVSYRLRKFVRRNRGPVVAATMIILALVVGIIGTSWGLVEAQHAKKAESERAD